MITSLNGNIFRVTGTLWGITGHRWIPLTKAIDTELWCFLWSAPKQTRRWWFETPSRSLWRHFNEWTYVRQILGALGIDSVMWHTGPTVVRHQYTTHFLFAVATVVLFPYRRILIHNTERERWRLRRIKRCCISVKSDRDGTGGYANNFITVWFYIMVCCQAGFNSFPKSVMKITNVVVFCGHMVT